jgi:hemolysin type calcium-binding protein
MKSSESLLGISVAALSGVVRAFVFALLLLLAAPAAAGAATVSVAPYVEPPLPPGDDGFGSCGRYAQCPADMLVFAAAAGEANQVTITWESAGFRQLRIVVREEGFPPVQAGPGCERLDDRTAACVAGAIGPVYLGDGDDRIDSPAGDVHGGEGADILNVRFSRNTTGDDGDDVLVGIQGDGGPGADLLAVTSGVGGAGDDILRCSPTEAWCHLDGGLGADVLTGGTGLDRLLGRQGNDVMQGGANFDRLAGGLGADHLVGGAGGDHLDGDSGADRLVSRENRSAGEARVLDRVDCGTGRRDLAVVDRADDVKRCERVARRDRSLARARGKQPWTAMKEGPLW